MNDQVIQETLEFLQECVDWKYNYNGVVSAIEALGNIPHPGAARILRDFIAESKDRFNGRDNELAENAGRALGYVIAALIEKQQTEGNV